MGILVIWATGRNILALLIILLLFNLVIIPVFYPGFPTLDMVYPLTTALLFGLLILYGLRRGFPDHPWTRWLALIPLAELLVD